MSLARKRIPKEVLDVKSNRDAGIDIIDKNDGVHLTGIIKGPSGTPYEGGTFHLSIELGDRYPYKPPAVTFATKIWHPNVSSQTGYICLDILKDNWSPAMTFRTVLLSVMNLLSDAVPDDPQDAVVAKEYIENRDKFNKTAIAWCKQYAGGSGEVSELQPPFSVTASAPKRVIRDSKIKTLMDLGFDEKRATDALKKAGGDVETAANVLLS